MRHSSSVRSSAAADDRVRVRAQTQWGTGEVLRVRQEWSAHQAKVLFKTAEGERVENVPVEWLEKTVDLWERCAPGDFDSAEDYRIK